MNALKRLRIDHWGWVHAKLALFVWGVLYLVVPPPGTYRELGYVLVLTSALFVIIGSLVSIIGLVLSTNEQPDKQHKGLAIEAFGLITATCGPLAFFVVQVFRLFEGEQFVTRAAFAYVLAALLIARCIVVLRALARSRYYGA